MTYEEAHDLLDFIETMGGCEAIRIKRARRGSGFALVVRMVGEPPRTYTQQRSAFSAYCGVPDEEETA